MKIAKTKNWADYLDDQTYELTDKASYAELEMYGLYVAMDSQVTFQIDAPSPGKRYSWFVSKTCEATFEYDIDWNPEMIERVYYEPIEPEKETEPEEEQVDAETGEVEQPDQEKEPE